MALSPRLQLVYDHLLPGQDVWDICCDHGYLGGTAYKSQKFKDIYFVDPVPSIMESLQQRFQKYVFDSNLKSKAIFLTLEAQKISQPMMGTVSIIGVGAMLINDILKATSESSALQAERLILGPHRDNEKILKLQNYELTETLTILENDRKREFFIFSAR